MLGIALSVGSLPLFGADSKIPMPTRALGAGSYALSVSALAFGCMGLNYHRSQSLSKKEEFIASLFYYLQNLKSDYS